MMNRILCLPVFLGIFLNAMGQQPAPKAVLKDAEFIIEKEHKHQLPESSRLFENAPIAPRSTDSIHLLPSTLPIIWPSFDIFSRKIRILRDKQEGMPRLYSNYFQGGYDNFHAPYLEGFFGNKYSTRYDYGLHLKHSSASQVSSFEEIHNLAQLHGKLYTEHLCLGGDVGYNMDLYPLCSFEEDKPATSLHSPIHQVTVHGSWANYSPHSFPYQLDAFYFLTSVYKTRENQWLFQGKGDYELRDTLALKATADVHFTQYTRTRTVYRNLYRCKPVLSWAATQNLTIQGGMNLVYQNAASTLVRAFNAYPVGEMQYALYQELRPYVGIGGDMQPNSLGSLLQENPWLTPNPTLLPTNQRLLLCGGIRGDLTSRVSFHTGLSVGFYQNFYCWVNSGSYPGYFDVQYDPEATLLNGFGELTYVNPEDTWTTRLRGDYYRYTLQELARPWHRPRYQLDLLSTYRLYDKIVCRGSVYWMKGMEALDIAQGLPMVLEEVVDLGLGIDYRWNPRISIFFDLQNLLARRNERYLRYPDKGFCCLAGLTYRW